MKSTAESAQILSTNTSWMEENNLNITNVRTYAPTVYKNDFDNVNIAQRIINSFSDNPQRFSTIATFYGTVILLSLAGNLLVFRTVLSKCARNSTNYLILNLALSDILMTVMNIPITVIDILFHDWIFGNRLCVLVPFFQACCVYVSSFTMLTIALNRYYLVYYSRSKAATYNKPTTVVDISGRASIGGQISISMPATDPLHSRIQRSSAVQIFSRGFRSRKWSRSKLWSLPAAIWLFALLHSVPFTNNLIVIIPSGNSLAATKPSLRRCIPSDTPFNELTLTLFVFVTQYLLPLVISGTIYLRIGMTISRLGHVFHTSVRVRRAAAAAAATSTTTVAAPAGSTTATPIGNTTDECSTLVSSSSSTFVTTNTVTLTSGSGKLLHIPRLSTTLFTANDSKPVIPTRSSSNGGTTGYLNVDGDLSSTAGRFTHKFTRKEAILMRKRRRILLLTLIVTIFAGCWLPFHIYFLLKDFNLIHTNERIFLMCHWLAMSSVCYNPIVYFWLNDSFRDEVKSLLSRFCTIRCRIFTQEHNTFQHHHNSQF